MCMNAIERLLILFELIVIGCVSSGNMHINYSFELNVGGQCGSICANRKHNAQSQ